MSTQSVRFDWTAPTALANVASDPRSALRHPLVRQALSEAARGLGLDPETVRVVGAKIATEGNVVIAEADPLRKV